MLRLQRSTGLIRGLFLLLPMLLVWGCGGGGDDTSTNGGAETGTIAGGSDAGQSGETAATVNDVPIFVHDVERVYENMKNSNLAPDESVEGDTPEERLRATALKVLIEQSLIVQAAAKDGITVEDGEVQAQLSGIKMSSGGEEAFQQALVAAGATLDEVTRDLKDNMIIRKYFTGKVDLAPEITDDEMKAFYDEHPEIFGPQPEVQASHILLKTTPGMDEFEKAEVIAKAGNILAKLKEGSDFAALAAAHSDDPTNAQSGGELGWFSKQRMVAPFAEAAFALEPGGLSEPVETQFGIHLIKVTDRRETPARSFEEAKDQLYQATLEQKIVAANQALVDDLRSKAKIEIL